MGCEPKTQGWTCLIIKDRQGHDQRKGLLGTRPEHVLGVERKAASYSITEGTSNWVISFSSAQTFKMNLPGTQAGPGGLQQLWGSGDHPLGGGAFWLLLQRGLTRRKKWNLTGLLSKGRVVAVRDGLFLWSALLIIYVGRNCFSWAVTDRDIQTVNETPSV